MNNREEVNLLKEELVDLGVEKAKFSFALKFGSDYKQDELDDLWEGNGENKKFIQQLRSFVQYNKTVKK